MSSRLDVNLFYMFIKLSLLSSDQNKNIMRIQLMKNIICDEFDSGPEEPALSCNECEECYFRLSTLDRITQDVKQLHMRRL